MSNYSIGIEHSAANHPEFRCCNLQIVPVILLDYNFSPFSDEIISTLPFATSYVTSNYNFYQRLAGFPLKW